MNSIEVQKESADIGPRAMLLEGTNNSMHCKQPKELQTEKATSRHNKPKKVNITEVISQDYVCTYEDIFVLQYITSSPKDKKLVDIGDAFLTKTELECLIHDNEFLNDDVISAYIYCVNAQEHLRYRAGGKVYLENTFISALIKRDGDVEISPADHNQIIKRVNIYLDHDMVFIPINIIRKHWYLAVINAKKHEIQVLDSFSAAMDRDDLTTTLWGLQNQLNIASQSEEFHQDHEWQDLNVTTWPVIEQFQEPMQSDSSSCGLFMLNYMEYWTGDMLSDCVTQEDMTKFRQKLAVILFDSELNTVKGSPRYEHIDDKEKISEDVVLQSPAKQIKRSNSSDGTKDRSSICPLSIPIMPTSAHELVGELCKYIMLIDDAECLEKEWVRSSKPYPISLSLKKLQDTLKMD